MGIFVIFVLSRALHPMVIDYSKVDGKMLYSKNSPAIMSQLLSMIFVNFLAWQEEGMKGVNRCEGLLGNSKRCFRVLPSSSSLVCGMPLATSWRCCPWVL
eukprot:s233_g42.t1